MQVSFNPVIHNNTSFKAYSYSEKGREYIPGPPTKEEISTAKTKKVISELKYIAFGIVILYFGMKRNLKYNKIKQVIKKEAEKIKTPKPDSILMNIKPANPNIINPSNISNINPMEYLGI